MVVPVIPPFRDEIRWGGALQFQFLGTAGAITTNSDELVQLISVNEVPSRTWDVLLTLEPVTGAAFDPGSELTALFKFQMGVGSVVTTFFRRLILPAPAAPVSPADGNFFVLTFPSSSFVISTQLILDSDPAQAFPLNARVTALAAPRMPFLASLESAEFQEGE